MLSEEQRKKVKAKLIENFLPLGLATCLIVALAWDVPGKELSKPKVEGYGVVNSLGVIIIFFISGMCLKTADVKAAIAAPVAVLYSLCAILFLTPMAGFIATQIPFSPSEFKIGLALFCCVPTTLTSGVALVSQAKGNAALALLLTVGSNVLGVLTVPFILRQVLDGANAKIDAIALFAKLGVTILGPLVLGKVFRELYAPVEGFTARNKVTLSLTNNSCLLIMVWLSMSNSASKLLKQPFERIVFVLLAGILLHVLFLLVNTTITHPLRIPWKERKAVILLTSQKTLPVSVTIISFLDESAVGEHGLIVIPCIIGHMSQLFIDAAIVSRWLAQANKEEELPSVDEPSSTSQSTGEVQVGTLDLSASFRATVQKEPSDEASSQPLPPPVPNKENSNVSSVQDSSDLSPQPSPTKSGSGSPQATVTRVASVHVDMFESPVKMPMEGTVSSVKAIEVGKPAAGKDGDGVAVEVRAG